MDQSAYSRLEAREDICAERLEHIAHALGTTPDVLRTYHKPDVANSVSEPAGTGPSGDVMLLTKDEIIKWQDEEIKFLRQQIVYQQAVWHQYCGGGQNLDEFVNKLNSHVRQSAVTFTAMI